MARNGIRSRSGCFTCRQRKKKCNEEKPTCSGCKRNCLQCYWPSADSVRGCVKKTTKEKAGVVRRPLHPSRNADEDPAPEEAAASADPLSPSRRHATQITSVDTQHQAVTASVARSDSMSSARRDSYSPRSPGGSFHMFMLPDLAIPQAEPLPEAQASLPVTVSCEWEEDDDNVFELEIGHGAFTAGDLEAVSSYSSISASSSKKTGSTPSPTHPIHSGMLRPEQVDAETIAGDMIAGGSEIIHDSIITDSDNNVDTLAAPGCLEAIGEAELVLGSPAHEEEPTAGTDTSMSIAMPGRMSLLPQQDPDAFHILSFYLSRTANCMGNGSTDSNPFLSTLIPLAFSDQLVLQLLLAQGAAHRQVGQAQTNGDQIAQRYYTGSLRLFRSAIREYISGKFTDKLVLATGSLILSLTEVARGDIEGNIFDHIIAAKSLLVELSVEKKSSVPDDFMDFLIEYYTHMSVLSMMSVKPQLSANPLLDPTIETLARKLIEKKYIGQLVGCWLELLLAIPHTFDLGQKMRSSDGPSPDDMVMFGLLQAQLIAFEPDTRASKETRLAALVFKQACLLYLWSILGCPQEGDTDGTHSNLMKTAVTEGIALLEQIPPTSRVNTSLCWPLTIIGCCTTERSLQSILRTRLQTMFSIIGLGNMGETLLLIELVWAFPSDKRSPWVLCELMQEQQRWVSFA